MKEIFIKRLQTGSVVKTDVKITETKLEDNHIIGLSHLLSQADVNREFKSQTTTVVNPNPRSKILVLY